MLKTTTIQLQSKPFEKNVVIYQDTSVSAKAAILYFHGGGLLYGDREDLPALHKELFPALIHKREPFSCLSGIDIGTVMGV